jgi:DNA-binding IscR family transcriptional regulator
MEEKLDGLNLDTTAFKVLCYLTFSSDALRPSDIASGTGQNPSTVRARLTELKDSGLVISIPEGYISAVNPHDILMKLYRDIKGEMGV